jgi:ribosomal protein S18 acetylase RimI-like enzyme
MLSILNAIKRRNYKKIWLWTTDNNIKAIKLYEKYGFTQQEIKKEKKDKIYQNNKWLKNKKIIYMIKYL